MLFLKRFKIRRLIKKLLIMQRARQHTPPTPESLKKEIDAYHRLAYLYTSVEGRLPFAREAACAAYRAAAMLDDIVSQYTLGKMLLDEAKERQSWEKQGLFSSQHNVMMIQSLFRDAHGFLEAAEKQNHIQAKRLRGLCYIHGWGVSLDQKKGFEMIVASIEQENSWDKVPQIFASLGLNNPDFFAQLTQIRDKK